MKFEEVMEGISDRSLLTLWHLVNIQPSTLDEVYFDTEEKPEWFDMTQEALFIALDVELERRGIDAWKAQKVVNMVFDI